MKLRFGTMRAKASLFNTAPKVLPCGLGRGKSLKNLVGGQITSSTDEFQLLCYASAVFLQFKFRFEARGI